MAKINRTLMKALRTAQNLTQLDVWKLCPVIETIDTVQRAESGDKGVRMSTLKQIADALAIAPNLLLAEHEIEFSDLEKNSDGNYVFKPVAQSDSVWLVMGKAEESFWQIAVQADDEIKAAAAATEIAFESGCTLSIDVTLKMTEEKALGNLESDFALLYLLASKKGHAAIHMTVEGNETS